MAEVIELANGFTLDFGGDVAAEAVELGRAKLEKFKADPTVQAALAKVETVEEAYDALGSYVDCTLDEFRGFFEQIAHRAYDVAMEAAGPKEELSEEELDVVAGGGFWGWLKKNVSAVVQIAAGAVMCVGAVAGYVASGIGIATGAAAPLGVAGIYGSTVLGGAGAALIVSGVKSLQ